MGRASTRKNRKRREQRQRLPAAEAGAELPAGPTGGPPAGADAATDAAAPGDARLVRRLLPAILLLALALRVVYVLAVSAGPYFADPAMDPLYHTQWARAFAAGEPFQEGPFFRAPLYPWFLGSLFRILGEDFLVVRLVQALLGTATTGLVYLVGSRAFDRRTGLLAALFAATYWVLVYFDGELLIPTLFVPLCLLALYLTLGLVPGARARAFLLAGVVWGVAALARPNVLVLLPALAAWLVWRSRPAWRAGLRPALLLILGFLLPVLPITARNAIDGGDLVLVSSQGGVNFYIGNNARSDGSSAWVPDTPQDWWGGYHATIAMAEAAEGRALLPSEVSRHYFRRALRYWRDDLGDALSLTLWKLRLFWMDWELGNNQHVRFFAHRFGPVVRFLPLSFALLSALGLLGFAVSLRGGSDRFPLAGFLVVYTATVVAFFVCSRFRVPVVPVLMIYAAYGCRWIVAAARARRWGPLAAGTALALAVGVQSRLIPDEAGPLARGPVDTSDAAGWIQLGAHALGSGDPTEAERLYREAIAARPGDLIAHRDLARALRAQGRVDDARDALRRALEIHQRDVLTLEQLADLENENRRFREAVAAAERLIRIAPTHVPGHYQLGRARFEQGDSQGAEASFRQGLSIRPDFNCAFALGSLALQRGRPAEAAEAFRQALRARPEPDAEGWYWQAQGGLLQALSAAGRTDELRAALAELHRRHASRPEARALLARFGGPPPR